MGGEEGEAEVEAAREEGEAGGAVIERRWGAEGPFGAMVVEVDVGDGGDGEAKRGGCEGG